MDENVSQQSTKKTPPFKHVLITRAILVLAFWLLEPITALVEGRRVDLAATVFYGSCMTVPMVLQLSFWPLIRRKPALEFVIVGVGVVAEVTIGLVARDALRRETGGKRSVVYSH
jgi:hypothetical protein